jgi:hypothetical protein
MDLVLIAGLLGLLALILVNVAADGLRAIWRQAGDQWRSGQTRQDRPERRRNSLLHGVRQATSTAVLDCRLYYSRGEIAEAALRSPYRRVLILLAAILTGRLAVATLSPTYRRVCLLLAILVPLAVVLLVLGLAAGVIAEAMLLAFLAGGLLGDWLYNQTMLADQSASGRADTAREWDGSSAPGRPAARRRQLVKPGEKAVTGGDGGAIIAVINPEGHLKWQVGLTYALQSGPRQKTINHLRVTAIRRERVANIDVWVLDFEPA